MRSRTAELLGAHLGAAADDDVDAGVGVGERLGEAGAHGVAEHERGGEEGDAEDDGGAGADQASLAGPQALRG